LIRLKELMKKENFKNGFYSGFSYLLKPIVQFLSTPILIYILGVEQYGIWIFFYSLISLMNLMQFGIGDATIKFVSFYKEKQHSGYLNFVISFTSILSILLGLIIGGSFYSFSSYIISFFNLDVNSLSNDTLKNIIIFFSISLFLHFIYNNLTSILKGMGKYDKSSMITLIHVTTINTAAIVLVFLFKDIKIVGWAFLGAYILCIIVCFYQIKKLEIGYKFNLDSNDKSDYKKILTFSIQSWSSNLGGAFYSQADKYVITAFLGPSALTYYFVANQIATQIQSVISNIYAYVFPEVSKKYSKRNLPLKELAMYFYKYYMMSTVPALILGLTIFYFSEEIISIWISGEVATQTSIILKFLVIGSTAMCTSIIPFYLLMGIGYIKQVMIFNWVRGITNIIFLIILVPWIGIIGGAISKIVTIPTEILNLNLMYKLIFKEFLFTRGLFIILSYAIPFTVLGLISIFNLTFFIKVFILVLVITLTLVLIIKISKKVMLPKSILKE
jgi:O-antigen/teichoic acid export membrane protein